MKKLRKMPLLGVVMAILFAVGVILSGGGFGSALGSVDEDSQEDSSDDSNEDSQDDSNEDSQDDSKDDSGGSDNRDSRSANKKTQQSQSQGGTAKERQGNSRNRTTQKGGQEENVDTGRVIAPQTGPRIENETEIENEDESEPEDESDADDVRKDTAELEAKIRQQVADEADAAVFSGSLAEANGLLDQAEAQKLKDPAKASELVQDAKNKVERSKKLLEIVQKDDVADDDSATGDAIAKDYKNSVAQFVHNLKAVADLEGSIGSLVREVAQAQNDDQAEVEDAIGDVESRNAAVEFLIGPKRDSLARVKTAVAENQAQIKTLAAAADQVADPAVELALQEQVKLMERQNTNLRNFVADSEGGISLFGWLVDLFSEGEEQ